MDGRRGGIRNQYRERGKWQVPGASSMGLEPALHRGSAGPGLVLDRPGNISSCVQWPWGAPSLPGNRNCQVLSVALALAGAQCRAAPHPNSLAVWFC